MKVIIQILNMLMVVVLLGIMVIFYAFKVEPYLLTVKEYTVNKNVSDEVLTVVQLSDLELSSDYTEKQLSKIVDKVNELAPDIIVFTGDLFANYATYRPTERVAQAFSSLESKYGKYAVWGNNDYGGGAVRIYADLMESCGFQLLKNDGVNITLENGTVIYIGGMDDSQLGNPEPELTMSKKSEAAKYSILLTHEPDSVENVKDNTIDMILSGHTHGGQVNIKFLCDSVGMNERYVSGAYKVEHLERATLYVSNGFGTSRMPVRFLAPPQIVSFQIGV